MGRQLPGLMSAAGGGHDGVAGLQADGSQDIALLAVLILDQGDECAAVGVVLQAQHRGGHVHLDRA